MPTEMTAPRISSNMAPSQPVAGVEIEAAGGEEAETDREENDVQHLLLSYRAQPSLAGVGAAVWKALVTRGLRKSN